MDEEIEKLHEEAPLTDVHVHPSLKAWMFDRNLWEEWTSPKGFNILATRADFNSLEKGKVGVIFASHYVPETELLENSFLIRAVARIAGVYDKLTSGSPFSRLFDMMDVMEREINRRPERVELAKSMEDLKRIREQGKIAVLHTVEGGHVLNGNPKNLDKLAERGVASLSLTHFYPNGIAANFDFIPDQHVTKIINFNTQTEGQTPLTDYGKQVLNRLEELKIIPDISHCNREARKEIYKELNENTPIIGSHLGVREIHPAEGNLDNEDIKEIAKRDGAIGVILYNHWLHPNDPDKGLPLIWKTIKHIHDITDSWDHIMIGTDFDGATTPPDEIPGPSHLPKITKLLKNKNLPNKAIKKILGGNAIRILEKTWK